MARTVPVYTYQAADGRSLRFAADSDFWITDMSGDDGLDIETKTSQSYGQTGKTITNQSVGERSITVTGAILRDLDANEALLKKLVRPLTAGRWCKTVGSTVWYLDVVPAPAELSVQIESGIPLLAHRGYGPDAAGRHGACLVPDACLDSRDLCDQPVQAQYVHEFCQRRQRRDGLYAVFAGGGQGEEPDAVE